MSAHSPYFSPSALGDAPADSSAFAIAFRFAGEHWLTVSGISILILAPCFWHREIVASDLGSHLYNAWLVQLIHRGQSPGLWIAPQHTNILFDIVLSNLGSILGLRTAEKLVVSLAVLTFFWGTFTFVSAAVQARTVVSAALHRARHLRLDIPSRLLQLLPVARPVVFWSCGVVARERLGTAQLARNSAPRFHRSSARIDVAGGRGSLYRNCGDASEPPLSVAPLHCRCRLAFRGTHLYLASLCRRSRARPFYSFNGADQLVLFGERYRILARALLVFALVSIVVDLIRRTREPSPLRYYSIPIQLYLLAMFSPLLLPDAIHFPEPTATIALFTERLTSITAVVGCCVLGAMHTAEVALRRYGSDCGRLFRVPLSGHHHRQPNGSASRSAGTANFPPISACWLPSTRFPARAY